LEIIVEIANPTTPATMADARFAKLTNDPRYRSSNFKKSRTKLDSRFQRLFTDEDFHKQASVDRYGRRITSQSGKRKLEKLYKIDRDEEKSTVDRNSQHDVVGSSEDEDEEEEASDSLATKDPARQGGFSESESEQESTSEEESEDEAELAEETAGHEQREEIPMGEVSKRIAVVNLDWDNIRAADIMAVASSFVPVGGQIDSVTIYPSEFGRERLEKEELEGPPREIFASSKRSENEEDLDDDSDEGSDAEDKKIERQLQEDQVNEGDGFDTAKLRQYQLERLRYYYAVISCSNQSTAKSLYDSMDGREYLSSANFFDLRFIPDDVSFEGDKPRDECSALPDGYKPNDFRTEALTHSKVKLTWDDDDATRKEVQKRAFSRAEMDENDLQAYIGSDSSDAESVSSRKSAAEDRKTKKREAARVKMRSALGLSAEATDAAKKKSKDDVVGDMQITFTSGLGGGTDNQGVFENEPQDEESTRDRYVRKERDRKQRRKEKMKATKSGQSLGDEVEEAEAGADEEDKGFDDPFFMDPAAAAAAEKKAKKMEKKQKLAKQAAQDKEAASRKAELELLMADDKADNLKHFDMREIEKAEKEARRKGKKKKDKKSATDDVQGSGEGFVIETEDPRFKAVFESHEYALDPTFPKFKQTAGMKRLLEEGRRKRKAGDLDAKAEAMSRSNKSSKGMPTDGELGGLVKQLKGSHQT
jgi:hypothetical protein